MSTLSLESPMNKADSFDAKTGAPSSTSSDLQPRGVSERTIIIIASTLAAVAILAIIFGAVHCVRRRRRRQDNWMRQQKDIKSSLQRARRPVLTIDTDLPRAIELTRSAGRATLPDLPVARDVPPVPLVQVKTALPTLHRSGMSVIGPIRSHSATRNPLGSHPPGVASRNAMRCANQDSRFEPGTDEFERAHADQQSTWNENQWEDPTI